MSTVRSCPRLGAVVCTLVVFSVTSPDDAAGQGYGMFPPIQLEYGPYLLPAPFEFAPIPLPAGPPSYVSDGEGWAKADATIAYAGQRPPQVPWEFRFPYATKSSVKWIYTGQGMKTGPSMTQPRRMEMPAPTPMVAP